MGSAAGWILVAALGFAYRGLLSYDPYGYVRLEIDPADAVFFSPTTAHPAVVLTLLVCVAAVRLRRVEVGARSLGSAVLALALLVPAVTLAFWSYRIAAPSVLVPSLALGVLGLGIALFGVNGGRAMFPAAALALFAAPLPATLVNQLMYPLQLATARFATAILGGLGRDPLLRGQMIGIPPGVPTRDVTEFAWFDVIEGCSGYGAMSVLTLGALVYVGVFRRRAFVAWLLVASAPAIAFLFNGLRVVSLVLNPSQELARVHTTQGLLMVAAGSVAFVALDRLLTRWWPEPVAGPRVHDVPANGGEAPAVGDGVVWGIAGAAAAGLALASVVVPAPALERWPEFRLSELPARLGDWEAEALPLDRRFLGTTRFSAWLHRRYQKPDGAAVDLFLGTDDGRFDHTDLLSPKLRLPGPAWELVSLETTALGAGRLAATGGPSQFDELGAASAGATAGPAVESVEVRNGEERRRSFLWRRPSASLAVEIGRSLLCVEKSPARREHRLLAIRLTTTVAADWRGPVAADARLREFAALLSLWLPALERPYDEHRARGGAGV